MYMRGFFFTEKEVSLMSLRLTFIQAPVLTRGAELLGGSTFTRLIVYSNQMIGADDDV